MVLVFSIVCIYWHCRPNRWLGEGSFRQISINLNHTGLTNCRKERIYRPQTVGILGLAPINVLVGVKGWSDCVDKHREGEADFVEECKDQVFPYC